MAQPKRCAPRQTRVDGRMVCFYPETAVLPNDVGELLGIIQFGHAMDRPTPARPGVSDRVCHHTSLLSLDVTFEFFYHLVLSLASLGHAFASAPRFRKVASPASDTSTHFGSGEASAS